MTEWTNLTTFPVPKALWNIFIPKHRLKPGEITVYVYLCYRADWEGFCDVSLAEIVRDTPLGEVGAKRAIDRLRAVGLVYVGRRPGLSSRYYLPLLDDGTGAQFRR